MSERDEGMSVKEFAEQMVRAAGIVYRSTDEPREDVVELLISYRQYLLTELAKQAEDSAIRAQQMKDTLQSPYGREYNKRCAHAVMWKERAAWLREQASK